MTHSELVELLYNAGFTSGWSLEDEALYVWEYDVDPPAPLVKPSSTEEGQ